MSARVSPTDRIRGEIDALFDGSRDLSEVIEDVARLGARLIIQTAVEAEVDVFLGRARYQRAAECPDARAGSHNGFCESTIKTTAGPVTVARPKLRGTTEAFASTLFGTSVTKSNALESLVIAGFVRGLSVRDVENTLADALGAEAALSKSTVSRVCQAIGDEFTQWSARRLDELELDYLFLARRQWRTTSPPKGGNDDHPGRDHPEESPPCCPVFLGFLIGATTVSLVGNVAHAVLPYIPGIVVQIGAATVPPIALLAAVHGIALAVRAGASGRVYVWAVGAVAVIGAGAFAVSFLALRDLMQAIGYSSATAWIFPATIDTAVAVSTLMLVALGDKPARRSRAATIPASAQTPAGQGRALRPEHSTNSHVTPVVRTNVRAHAARHSRAQDSASVQPGQAQTLQSEHTEATQVDADVASDLIASGVTTQSVDTVIAVLSAHRDGASINAAAKESGINYRTAQRIVEAATVRRQLQFAAVG